MTENNPGSAQSASERLHEMTLLRDQELDFLDAEYAKALASGQWNPRELHYRYLQTREAAAARHGSGLSAAHLDYIGASGTTGTPIAVPPAKGPYPPPGMKAAHTAVAAKSNNGVLRKLSWVGAGLLAVVALAAVSSISSSSTKTADISPVTEPISTIRIVTYEIVGGAKTAAITFETPSGTSQSTIRVPLKNTAGELVTFEMERGDFVYLSAQNKGTSGNIICRISVDGVVISTNTSSGPYAIASCDGTVP